MYKAKKMSLVQGIKSNIEIIIISLIVLALIGFFIWIQILHH